eukprot:6186116-Pleurochrysis_carterae.AAC.2
MLLCMLLSLSKAPPPMTFEARVGQLQLIKASPRNYSLSAVSIADGAGVVVRPTLLLEKQVPRNASNSGWVFHSGGTIRPRADARFAVTANLTKEPSELTFKVFLWHVLKQPAHGIDPDQQEWIYYPRDQTLRLKRYPDTLLGVNWWTRVSDWVQVCAYTSNNGLHHKANREWTWPLATQAGSPNLASEISADSSGEMGDLHAFVIGFGLVCGLATLVAGLLITVLKLRKQNVYQRSF